MKIATLGGALALLAAVACGETSEDVIEEFVTESGHAFADCGAGASCSAAGSCMSDAFATCTPSRADLDGDVHFVMPSKEQPGACVVVVFMDAGADTLERLECLELIAGGNCVETSNCTVTNRWHL